MKKSAVVLFIFLFLIFAIFPFTSAVINSTTEQIKVDNAYNCLIGKTNSTVKCQALNTEEKIFTLLAVNQCQAQVVSASNQTCWPSGNCQIKTTAQAIIALDNAGVDTTASQNWLASQAKPTTDLSWFLEIESSNATSCTVDYSAGTFNFDIAADKKINADSGACLTVDPSGYWYQISPSCYSEAFDVSCNKNFLTTLLFTKAGASTVHVSPQSSTAAAGGTTTEQIDSSCFVENGACAYEGSLWATLALNSQGKDVSSYLPYLVALAEDNRALLSDSFLYFITNDNANKISLLSKQKSKKWWLESGDKFYDTALALFPFQQQTLQEKTNSKEWLLSVQDANGCWENNVRNTAFILASLWPRNFPGGGLGGSGNGTNGGTSAPSCTAAGYYCVSTGNCDGRTQPQFDCPSLFNCCNVPTKQQTCSEIGGKICSSSQICQGGTITSASDLKVGQNCCFGGTCQESTSTLSECETAGGTCRATGCNSNENLNSLYFCSFSTDTCCVSKPTSKTNLLWVWILLVLIVLVVIGIIFRDKLKSLFNGKKSSGPQTSSSSGRPPFSPSPQLFRRPVPERRFVPSAPSRVSQRAIARPKSGAQRELDDVLKKLKDMAK